MNPIRSSLIVVIRLYQLLLSPWLGTNCRFTPNCSTYAIEAIQRYGAIKGSWLAAKRLLRCQPWGQSGHDPVCQTHSHHH
ncbi:MAG: membrane protein insertion efficiency factor YidD [Rickettsiales bacterium]|jgi:putative membrane protein insertion efficiency factor|nr:membrane protein insertion efficiency factor YidD [Rickettsiales bacterium]